MFYVEVLSLTAVIGCTFVFTSPTTALHSFTVYTEPHARQTFGIYPLVGWVYEACPFQHARLPATGLAASTQPTVHSEQW